MAALVLTVAISGPTLVVQDTPRQADAIVVIGGDHKTERVRRAVELYERGYAPIVILSAGTVVLEGGEKVPEAKVMYKQALALGIPRDSILVEDQSTSTAENAAFAFRILQAHGYRSILLVTSLS